MEFVNNLKTFPVKLPFNQSQIMRPRDAIRTKGSIFIVKFCDHGDRPGHTPGEISE